MASNNTNPGNFANRPKDEVRKAASKGGHASALSGHTENRGLASMNPDKRFEISSKGGQATSASKGSQATPGSFEAGSEEGSEAGHKGEATSGNAE